MRDREREERRMVLESLKRDQLMCTERRQLALTEEVVIYSRISNERFILERHQSEIENQVDSDSRHSDTPQPPTDLLLVVAS